MSPSLCSCVLEADGRHHLGCPNSGARAALYSLFAVGWIIVLVTTCLINHFDLFGLPQVWLYYRGQSYVPLNFVTPGPYQFVRHPLYVGWLTVFWATPTMTAPHLLFAMGTTAYILIAIFFEERDLSRFMVRNTSTIDSKFRC